MTLVHDDRHELRPTVWWREQPADMIALPEHIIDKLVAAGLATVEDVRKAGPHKIREIEGIGNAAFEEIKAWLRALDGARQ